MNNIKRASNLMAWLMREKGIKRNVALAISCNKYKINFSKKSKVSKEATKINSGIPLFKEVFNEN